MSRYLVLEIADSIFHYLQCSKSCRIVTIVAQQHRTDTMSKAESKK